MTDSNRSQLLLYLDTTLKYVEEKEGRGEGREREGRGEREREKKGG
jgi:hypothetical protein